MSAVVLARYVMSNANQEHGIVSAVGSLDADIARRFPVGTQLRVLPNHACATGAQFPQYHAVEGDEAGPPWSRFYGW